MIPVAVSSIGEQPLALSFGQQFHWASRVWSMGSKAGQDGVSRKRVAIGRGQITRQNRTWEERPRPLPRPGHSSPRREPTDTPTGAGPCQGVDGIGVCTGKRRIGQGGRRWAVSVSIGTGELDSDKARVPESRVLQAAANNVTAMPV